MQTFADFRRQFELGIERFLLSAEQVRDAQTHRGRLVPPDDAHRAALDRDRICQGEWQLLHRHADPLMSKTAPTDVLSR